MNTTVKPSKATLKFVIVKYLMRLATVKNIKKKLTFIKNKKG